MIVHNRAISSEGSVRDIYDSLDASTEASAMISAFLSLKAAIERAQLVDATAAEPATPARPPVRALQAFGFPHIDPA